MVTGETDFEIKERENVILECFGINREYFFGKKVDKKVKLFQNISNHIVYVFRTFR